MFVSSGLLNAVASQRGSDPLPPSVEQTLLAKHRYHLHQKRISNNQSPLPQHSRHSSSLASPMLSCFGPESGSVGYNTEAASSDVSPAKLHQFTAASFDGHTRDAEDHQTECLLDAVTSANTEKVQRLLRLTKRRCLSLAACALLLEWTPPGSVHKKNAGTLPPKGGRSSSTSDLSNGSSSQSPAELVSTLQQYREPLERFLLKMLAAASIVTPYSFVVALFYLKHLAGTIAKGGQRSIVLHQSNLHMTMLAALLVAVKVNGEDVRYQTLVEQFSVLAGCSVAELAAAERVMLAKLLTATSGTNSTSLSLLPSPQVLQKFAEQDLLQASTSCNHDVTSGHHCWVSLLCGSIQPYPTEATVLSLASLCSSGSESGSSERAFLPQGLQVVPEGEAKWFRSVDSQALGSAFGDE